MRQNVPKQQQRTRQEHLASLYYKCSLTKSIEYADSTDNTDVKLVIKC